MIGEEKSQAQPRNVEGSGVIARAVPQTRGIATTQPGRPLQRLLAISFGWRAIGVCGLATMGAGVRGATRLDLARSDAKQMALVLEHAPQLAAHRRVVPPIAPPPTNPLAPALGFERGQVFATNQPAVVEQCQQDQQVGSQMGQLAIASFILFPAGLDAPFIGAHLLLPARKMHRQRRLLLTVSMERLLAERVVMLATWFQAVNLPAHAGLPLTHAH